MENQKCASCGKDIKNPQMSVQRNNQTFCSEACANKSTQQK